MTEAIDSLDLIDPSRSTLKENNNNMISSATLSLEDVISDLKDLEWQECRVTSLQILNATKEASPSSSTAVAAGQVTPIACTPQVTPKPFKRKRDKKASAGSRADLLPVVVGRASPSQKKKMMTMNNNKKMKMKKQQEVEAGSGGGAVNGGGSGNGSALSSALVTLGSS